MTAMPWPCSRPMMSNSRSLSRAVSEVVGSSKMTIRASAPSAFEISTSCRSPWLSRATGVPGASSRSTAASSSLARSRIFRRSMKGSPGTSLGNPVMKRFSSMVRFLKRFSSWWMKAMPLASASLGPVGLVGLALERHPAGLGLVDAAQDVHRRRLAGPVLADEAQHLAGCEPEAHPVQHLDAEEAFRQPLDLEQGGPAQPRAKSRWRWASMIAAPRITAPLIANTRGERQPHQLQALVDHGEEKGAIEGPDDLSLAAEQADAADHGGPDDVEQDALAQHRRAGLEPAGIENGRRPGADARDHVGPEDRPAHRHARDLGGARVDADGEEPAAVERCGPSATWRRDADRGRDQDREGQAEHLPLAQKDKSAGQVADAAAGARVDRDEPDRGPAEEHHRRQRHDEGRHPERA